MPGNSINVSDPLVTSFPPSIVVKNCLFASTSLTARWMCPSATPMSLAGASCAKAAVDQARVSEQATASTCCFFMAHSVAELTYYPPSPHSEELHEACRFSIVVRARLRAGAAGGRSGRGQAGAHGQGAVPHSGLLQRLPDSLERQHSARAQYGLSHPLCRLRVREPDSGLADQSGLRLVRSERAGYGWGRRTRPCDVYGCNQEWSAHAQGDQCRADAVPQCLLHPEESRTGRNHSVGPFGCQGLHPDHGQRAAEGLACRAETRRGDGTDHANSPGSQSLRPRRRTGRDDAWIGRPRHGSVRRRFHLAGCRADEGREEHRYDPHRIRRIRAEIRPAFKSSSRLLLEIFSDLRIAGPAATPASVRQEFLHTTGAIDLADVDVALRVDAQRVRPVKGARLPAACAEASQFGEVVTIEDVDREIRQVSDVHAGLFRIPRKRDRTRRAAYCLRRHQNLANEAALAGVAVRVCARLANLRGPEHLHTIVAAVGDVEEAIAAHLDPMQRATEKLRLQLPSLEVFDPGAAVRGIRALANHRVLPVGAEMSDVLAGRGVDHENAPVSVPIGDVQDVGRRIHRKVRWQIRLRRPVRPAVGVVAVRLPHAVTPDGEDEGAIRLELQDLGVVAAEVGRPGILAAVGAAIDFSVAGDPDEVVVVDKDAVFTSRPVASIRYPAFRLEKAGIGRAAPGLQQISVFVELQH